MKRSFLVVATLLAAVGCSRKEATTTPRSTRPTSGPGALMKFSGGGTDDRPRVAIAQPSSGATSVDPSRAILLKARGVGDMTAAAVGLAMEETISLRGSDGIALPFKATIERSNEPSWEYRVQLLPTDALKADTWYRVEGTSTDEVVYAFAEDEADESVNKVIQGVTFFTGSAPMIRKLSVTTHPSKPIASISVELSEAVQASSIAGGFVVNGPDGPLSGCLSSNGKCLAGDDSRYLNAFDFILNTVIDQIPRSLEVRIQSSVQGTGRNVGDASALGLARHSDAEGLSYHIADVDWKRCDEQGHRACWRPQ